MANRYFTKEDKNDLQIAFQLSQGKTGDVLVAEVYNNDLLELTDEEIVKELRSMDIEIPINLYISRAEGGIELLLR